ncbi:hypothetical protein ACR80S_12320 [Halomonas sp. MA07-2]|uniref:hypothetical protein n=1 Tax=Halomonas sp. MA07-2 TaxID=3440841 RepID=UPI003EEEFBE2
MKIELAGASGIGKTTALKLIGDIIARQHDAASGDILTKAIKESGENKSHLQLKMEVDQASVFKSSCFIDSYLVVISELTASFSQKINLVRFIDKHLKDYLARQFLDFRHLVIDEGFVHASFPLSQFSCDLVSSVRFFIDNVPLPDAVIQLHANPQVLLYRIQQRERVVNSYRYKSEEKLICHLSRVDWYLSIMESALRKRGCRVRHIDANGPVEQWAKVLEDVIEEEIFIYEKGLKTPEPLC